MTDLQTCYTEFSLSPIGITEYVLNGPGPNEVTSAIQLVELYVRFGREINQGCNHSR